MEETLDSVNGSIDNQSSPYKEPKNINNNNNRSHLTSSTSSTNSTNSNSTITTTVSASLSYSVSSTVTNTDDLTNTTTTTTNSSNINTSQSIGTESLISTSSTSNGMTPLNMSTISTGSSISSSTVSVPIILTQSRNFEEQSLMIRVKLPESHPLITKVLRLPLNSTIKDCIYKIHQIVNLGPNVKDCVISHHQSILPMNSLLSTHFGSSDESIVHTIEVKEILNSNVNHNNHNNNIGSPNSNSHPLTQSRDFNQPTQSTSKPRPLLLHSNSVQSLLSMGVTKKRNSNGQKDLLIFQAPPPSYTKDLENLIWVQSPNHPHKTIPCLYHKWRSRDQTTEAKITILYSAGNFEDIGITKKLMKILSGTLQCNIFCYDYTGFGLNSSGSATIKELYEDIFIIFNHLTNTLKIPSKNIILMGKSIGTIATLKFASTLFPKQKNKLASLTSTPTSPIEQCKQYKSVGGLILLNAFGPGGLSENIVNMILSFDAFDHLKKIDRVTCPVLLIHGEDDQIVNIKSSKKLGKTFGSHLHKFVRVKDAGHFNIDTLYLDDYEDHLIDFIKFISPESFKRKVHEVPAQYSMSPNKVVGNWLERMGLGEYSQNFLQYGYFDLASISTLDSSMLEMMGITDESHLSILQNEIEKISDSYVLSSKRNSSNSTSSNNSGGINQHIKSLSSSTRNSQNLTESPSTDTFSHSCTSNNMVLHSNSTSSVSSSCCSADSDCTCSDQIISIKNNNNNNSSNNSNSNNNSSSGDQIQITI